MRTIWSAPDTRTRLLQGLAEKGFGADQLAEMQAIIDAENSDLFDVLAHVAYALPPTSPARSEPSMPACTSTPDSPASSSSSWILCCSTT